MSPLHRRRRCVTKPCDLVCIFEVFFNRGDSGRTRPQRGSHVVNPTADTTLALSCVFFFFPPGEMFPCPPYRLLCLLLSPVTSDLCPVSAGRQPVVRPGQRRVQPSQSAAGRGQRPPPRPESPLQGRTAEGVERAGPPSPGHLLPAEGPAHINPQTGCQPRSRSASSGRVHRPPYFSVSIRSRGIQPLSTLSFPSVNVVCVRGGGGRRSISPTPLELAQPPTCPSVDGRLIVVYMFFKKKKKDPPNQTTRC